MKIKNLKIEKIIKTTAIALVTGTVLMTVPSGNVKNVEAANNGIYYGIDANYYSGPVYYFTDIMNSNMYNILDKSKTENNLKSVLKIYKELHNFIYKNTYVSNRRYTDLTEQEQQQLYFTEQNWKRNISDAYRNQYYYTSACKSILGTKLTYVNENYYESNYEIMRKFEDKEETFNKYIYATTNNSNLKSALDAYKYLLDFINGKKISQYYFTDLNPNERQELIRTAEIWTATIESKFGGLSTYSETCRSKVKFIVNLNNFYNEISETLKIVGNNVTNNQVVLPQNPTVQIPTGNIPQAVPTVPNIQTQVPNVPTQIPTVQQVTPAPAVPNVENTQTQSIQQPRINNTIGKDWKQNYIDPRVDTSRGVRDFVPENVNDIYGEEEYIRYPQNSYQYGYYDNYGNYIPYNNYNNYNDYNGYYYEDGYTPDYVPSKVLR